MEGKAEDICAWTMRDIQYMATFRTKSGCSIVRTRLWRILSKSTFICCPSSKSLLFTRSLGRTDCRNFSASGRDALLERALHVFLLLLGHVVPLESGKGDEGVRPEDAAGGQTAEDRAVVPDGGLHLRPAGDGDP